MRKAVRIFAFLFGILLGFVQLQQVPKLPLPTNGEAIGYGGVWILFVVAAVYLIGYGVGWFPRKKSASNEQGNAQ